MTTTPGGGASSAIAQELIIVDDKSAELVYRHCDDRRLASFDEVLDALATPAEVAAFARSLCLLQGGGVFFECRPVTASTLAEPFEATLTWTAEFDGFVADSSPFAAFVAGHADPAVAFKNKGGDATLIIPTPYLGVPRDDYAHLRAFMCSTRVPAIDKVALWSRVASVLRRELSERPADTPLWLSTAGLGVHWLHVRIDTQPKYYQHEPYKTCL
jgi:hypothetical protein